MVKSKFNVERDTHLHFENKPASWHFFIFLFALYSIVYMTKNCFNAALADIVNEGILTKSQTGSITAAFYIVYAPLQIVGGMAADHFSPHLLIKIGLIGGAVANSIIFFNQNYFVMLITWVLNAVVQFAVWPSVFKIMTSELCRSERKHMIFYMSLSATVGLLGNYLLAAFLPSWEYNFAVSAALLLGLAVGIHFYDRHINKYMIPDRVEAVEVKATASVSYSGSSIKLFWFSGMFLLLIPVFVRSVIGQGIKSLSPTMIMETYGMSPQISNLLNIFIIIAGIAGTMMVRFLLKDKMSDMTGIAVFMILTLGLSVALLFSDNLITTMIILCLMSTTSTAPTLFMSYFNSGFSKYGKNATATGIYNTAGSLGVCASGYVIAVIADNFGWGVTQGVWCASLLVSVIVALILIPMNNRFKKKEAESALDEAKA
ncbi:MAG: MFS transporter [Clostridia bacterium]|nr:MFS transporter [Clostridia bacterium]